MPGRRARGEGSIRKRQDGRWEGRYTAGRDDETGKLIYKSVLAKTQTECKRKLREVGKSASSSDHEFCGADPRYPRRVAETNKDIIHCW